MLVSWLRYIKYPSQSLSRMNLTQLYRNYEQNDKHQQIHNFHMHDLTFVN